MALGKVLAYLSGMATQVSWTRGFETKSAHHTKTLIILCVFSVGCVGQLTGDVGGLQAGVGEDVDIDDTAILVDAPDGVTVPETDEPRPPADPTIEPLSVANIDIQNPTRAVVHFAGTNQVDTDLEARTLWFRKDGSGHGFGSCRWKNGDQVAVEGLVPDTTYSVSFTYYNGEKSEPISFTTPSIVEESNAPVIDTTRMGTCSRGPMAVVYGSDDTGVDRVEFFANGELYDTYDVSGWLRTQPADGAADYFGYLTENLSGDETITATVYDLLGNSTTVTVQ